MGASHAAVLIVEDHDELRWVLARVLTREGFAVAESGTAQEGLAMIRDIGPVDLVIVDAGIPDRNEPGLRAELYAMIAATPILFISGNDRETVERRHGLAADAAFLMKPFAIRDLLDTVRLMLASKPG